MQWVTRKNANVDRIACPWLIRHFIDPAAEFRFVPPEEVLAVAEQGKAIPFDIPGVELGHIDPGEIPAPGPGAAAFRAYCAWG